MRKALKQAAAVAAFATGVVVALGPAAPVLAQGAWVAPAAEKAKKNPLPANTASVAQGKKVADVNCASCHGATGKGDGPAAVAINPKPADWTSKKLQAESDGEIFWKLSTGRGAMPPWKFLPENDRWALVSYIRSLAAK